MFLLFSKTTIIFIKGCVGPWQYSDGVIVMKTIDDVVKNALGEYQLNSSSQNKKIYRTFLKEETDSRGWKFFHSNKQASKFSYLCAKLFLFSVMGKMTPVKENYMSEAAILDDMGVLSCKGSSSHCWQDERLYKAFDVLSHCSRILRLPNYVDTINELGKHPFVVERWDGPVRYTAHYNRRPNRNSSTLPACRSYTVGRLRTPFIRNYLRD